MFKKLRQWWQRQRALNQFGCALWCPKCGEELHYHASDIKSHPGFLEYTYYCKCGLESRWFFGAPVPILMHESRRDSERS